MYTTVVLEVERQKQEDPCATSLADLAKSVSSKFNERPYLKNWEEE